MLHVEVGDVGHAAADSNGADLLLGGGVLHYHNVGKTWQERK